RSRGLGMQAANDNLCRDDAIAKPSQGGAALAGVVGVAVGLMFGLGLGVGLGANFNSFGLFGGGRFACPTPPLCARARFVACSVSDAEDVAGRDELEAMLAHWRARYAEPKWGTP